MTIKVNKRIRGMVSGSIGTIVDVEIDKKGNRCAIVEWKDGRRGISRTKELFSHLDWMLRKGGLVEVKDA